ncbi:PREDICTED: putative defense protein 3 [Branchiostoma belcheri]|uniref:Defense protein 3 n=1 Tax=Branchiostoma belcheri TaxID=7741 RepID=A0A6P4ZH14_BRABE|nr:PREDICTED: putative defense protein 3 [Branchiostoma belcheri]
MCRVWLSVFLVYFTACSLQLGACFPGGAPTDACQNLTPGHVNITANSSATPFTLMPVSTTYQPGGTLVVRVMGADFRGILLQARNSTNEAVGFWSDFPDFTRSLTCNNSADSVTHQNTSVKVAGTNFTWNAPRESPGDVVFWATIAQSREQYWANITSDTVSGGNRVILQFGVFSLLNIILLTNWMIEG